MMFMHPTLPGAVVSREGVVTRTITTVIDDWHPWFAWYPVQNTWTKRQMWLQRIDRRTINVEYRIYEKSSDNWAPVHVESEVLTEHRILFISTEVEIEGD